MYTNTACSLAATVHIHAVFFPNDQLLVKTIPLYLVVPKVCWPRKAPLPYGLPVQNFFSQPPSGPVWLPQWCWRRHPFHQQDPCWSSEQTPCPPRRRHAWTLPLSMHSRGSPVYKWAPLCRRVGGGRVELLLRGQNGARKKNVWEVWQCVRLLFETRHGNFGTNCISLRCQQHALPVHSKKVKRTGFHAIRMSSQCAVKDPQWIGRICAN